VSVFFNEIHYFFNIVFLFNSFPAPTPNLFQEGWIFKILSDLERTRFLIFFKYDPFQKHFDHFMTL